MLGKELAEDPELLGRLTGVLLLRDSVRFAREVAYWFISCAPSPEHSPPATC